MHNPFIHIGIVYAVGVIYWGPDDEYLGRAAALSG